MAFPKVTRKWPGDSWVSLLPDLSVPGIWRGAWSPEPGGASEKGTSTLTEPEGLVSSNPVSSEVSDEVRGSSPPAAGQGRAMEAREQL